VFNRSDELEFGGQPGTRAGLNLPAHDKLVIDTVESALTR